jgi:hypothetical protein
MDRVSVVARLMRLQLAAEESGPSSLLCMLDERYSVGDLLLDVHIIGMYVRIIVDLMQQVCTCICPTYYLCQ